MVEILIDNGHGSNTAGKCSPDKTHREYLWSRAFADRLVNALGLRLGSGGHVRRIVTESWDVSIRERVRRVNAVCKEVGKWNVLVVSLHNDAMPPNDNQWHSARGFSARVSLNASAKSKILATYIAQAMDVEGVKVRKPLPNQWYWMQNLGICRDTDCAAVLTENLFQDNRDDVKLLQDEAFLDKLCSAHVKGIEDYINFYKL